MDSNNEPPKTQAKKRTPKPRAPKASSKSNAPVEPEPTDAGVPISANSTQPVYPNFHPPGFIPSQRTQEANSLKFVPSSQDTAPKDQTAEASALDSPRLDDQHRQSSTPAGTDDNEKNMGNVPNPVSLVSGIAEESSVESLSSRVSRLPGEGRSGCHERLRRLARSAGMPRGQGPGTAYNWAFEQTDRLFAQLAEENSSPLPVEELPADPEPELKQPKPAPSEPASQKTGEETAKAAPVADLGVAGLGEIPESWPELPANAQLQVEIAWVSANRLKVRAGSGVDLSRALSPAPSYSALSWLETSILFPSKFADISVKATADQDNEKEEIRREKLAIEEIRSILKEMMTQ